MERKYKDEQRILRFKERMGEKTAAGCIEWQGSILQRKGYGQFWYGGGSGEPENITSHRAAWILFKGPIPEGLQVLHKCNNRKCVNVWDEGHVYLGTHEQNMRDRDESGHTSKWDHRYNFTRNPELVEKIKRLFLDGLSAEEVRQTLNIGWQTIYRSRDQDAELKQIMIDTKSARYAKGAAKRLR